MNGSGGGRRVDDVRLVGAFCKADNRAAFALCCPCFAARSGATPESVTPIHRQLSLAMPRLQVTSDLIDRTHYARDLWPRHHLAVRAGQQGERRPAAIAWPESTDDVVALVRWAREEGAPLVPFGAGSGVCAAVLPSDGTVVVDMKRMARVRRIDPDAPAVEVEAGHLGVTLERTLGRSGFTMGHFPSSIVCSTAGGWVATRSAGQCSGAYGKIEDMTAAIECVDGRGRVLSLLRRTSAPDLVPLVVGSEGTLAVVTAATFRLHPTPAARSFGAWTFRSTSAGLDAMRAMFQAGLRPAVARLYDPFDAMLARRHRAAPEDASERAARRPARSPGIGAAVLRTILKRPERLNDVLHSRAAARLLGGAMLVVLFEGTGGGTREGIDGARRIAERAGGTWDGEAPARQWFDRRYSVSFRQSGIFARGAFVDTMEVAAPWSRLETVYDEVRRALGRHVFVMAHFSHAYPDGCCMYFSFAGVADPSRIRAEGWDGASASTYDAAWSAALTAAVSAGAAVSHHHGVGRSKAPWLRAELGDGVNVVRALQRAFDPGHILNPGALVDGDSQHAPDAPRPVILAPSGDVVDRASLLVAASGTRSVADIDDALHGAGLSLGLGPAFGLEAHRPRDSVARWIARGAPGVRDAWLDPADHWLAGLDATLHSGRTVHLAPAPRRAVGPDLASLFVGANDRFGRVDRAWLRVHVHGAHRPTSEPFVWRRDPPLVDIESAVLDDIAHELGS
jgi:alkyldihydroxyacetonephosphate synthase